MFVDFQSNLRADLVLLPAEGGFRLRLQDKSPAALPTAFPGDSNHWAGHSAGIGVRLTLPKPFCCTHTTCPW